MYSTMQAACRRREPRPTSRGPSPHAPRGRRMDAMRPRVHVACIQRMARPEKGAKYKAAPPLP